jgi:hypothetical protein
MEHKPRGERRTNGDGEQNGAASGGEVFDMLGQIGLLQVDEGYTYKDFLILFDASWTIELDLVSSIATEQNLT